MARLCPFGLPHSSSTTRPGKCWTCEQKDRESACAHDSGRVARWAGILGYRYDCASCGKSNIGESNG
jgi:hypothetical protein